MDWLKEILKDLENAEELQKSITKGIGENFVSKADFNAVNETKKRLEGDIKDRDKQLEDLKKVDAEGLRAEIERLQGENKTTKEKYEADIKDLTLTNAVKLAIAGKVHDESIVSGLLDKSKLIIGDDGKVVGLDEQINTLKEGKSFLFKEDDANNDQKEKPSGFQRIGNPPPNNPAAIDDQIAAAFGNTTEAK